LGATIQDTQGHMCGSRCAEVGNERWDATTIGHVRRYS
jgi:hypothetical protein